MTDSTSLTRRVRPLRLLLLVPAALLAIGLTGCPGDDGDSSPANNGDNNGVNNGNNGNNGTAEICDDGIDNDGDGDADCEDIACAADPACNEPDCTTDDDCGDGEVCEGGACIDAPPEQEICDDGVDNDGDDATDCEDEDCATDRACEIAACRDLCDAIAACDEFVLACGAEVAAQAAEGCRQNCDDDEVRPQILGFAGVACDVVTPIVIDASGLADVCVFEAEICDDGIDNDGDEAADCDDDDCAADRSCELALCREVCSAIAACDEFVLACGAEVAAVAGDECQLSCEDDNARPGILGFDGVACDVATPLVIEASGLADICIFEAEICDDGIDNDGDESTDCDDLDCTDALNCQIEICDDEMDNNGDDAVDCADEDCAVDPACIGDATPIAPVGETVVLTGSVEDTDPTFIRPNANCSPRVTEALYYYDAQEIVNTLGVSTSVEVTANWLGDGADGFLFVYARPLDLETGCVAGDDDFATNNRPALAGSQIADVEISAGQFLTVLATSFNSLDAIGDFEISVRTLTPPESACDDGNDNDGDELVDCADDDCADAPVCQEVCDDNIDNDLDEDTDCEDDDCAFDPACVDISICDAPPALVLEVAATGTFEEGQGNNFTGSCTTADGPEAVYALTVAEAGTYCLHTQGSEVDTVLHVRTPDCANADGEVACNDDGGPGLTSEIELVATAGTYYVFVDSFSNDLGAYTLNARAGTCVEQSCDDNADDDNDGDTDCADSDCVDAPNCQEVCDDNEDNDLDGLTDCADLDDCGADPVCGEICDNETDDNDNQLTDCEEPTCFGHPACAEGPLFIAEPGGSVATEGSIDDTDLLWDRVGAFCTGNGAADHFFDAIAITNDTGADQIVDVTAQWFGDGADGFLHAFGDPWDIVNLNNCIIGDDDEAIDGGPSRAGSRIRDLEIADGETLVLIASTFSPNDAIGEYTITVETQQSPAALCEDATLDTITAEGTYNGDTSEFPASRFSSECGGASGPEAVYAFTVDAETTVCADTVGTTYDTVLSVRADCTDANTEITCNDDTFGLQSQIEFTAMPGTTYSIFVDSFGGNGLYSLNVGFGACVQE